MRVGGVKDCVSLPEGGYYFWDDVNGKVLDSEGVRKARRDEIDFVQKMKLYDIRPVSECCSKTGGAPIRTRWVDTDKGGGKLRSRVVAMDFKTAGGPRRDLYSPPPLLEVVKALLALAASKGKMGGRDPYCVLHSDVSRAYFNAPVKRDCYVVIPDEDDRAGPGPCGKLNYSMYGTREAATSWEDHYSDWLLSLGFRRGRASICVFWHPGRDICTVVHGDDFVTVGDESQLVWLRAQMEKVYESKHGMLGPAPRHRSSCNANINLCGNVKSHPNSRFM